MSYALYFGITTYESHTGLVKRFHFAFKESETSKKRILATSSRISKPYVIAPKPNVWRERWESESDWIHSPCTDK